jgi:hypothetical protein
MSIIIYISIELTIYNYLGYDYNYIKLITYLHHIAKLHMLNVKWWTLTFHVIFQIILQFV